MPMTPEGKQLAAEQRAALKQAEQERRRRMEEELNSYRQRAEHIQSREEELASIQNREEMVRQLEEQLNKRQLEFDGVEQNPRPKKTAKETIEGYVAENAGDEAKDDIIAITTKMSDDMLVQNIKGHMQNFQTLLAAKKLCDDPFAISLAEKIGAKDDPLEGIKANKEKFLPYILIATVYKSKTKDKKVWYEGKLQPIDDYRKKVIGENSGTDEKSRKQMFTDRKDAGVAYEQFFLQADETFNLESIPQITSIAKELGRVSLGSQDKTKGKWKGQLFRPKHIPEVWNHIMLKFDAQPPYKVFRKELRDELFGDGEAGSGGGGAKDGIRVTCMRALKQLLATQEYLREHNIVIPDAELLGKINDIEEVDAEDVLVKIPNRTPPGSTGSNSTTLSVSSIDS